jgi:hypothetical protein
MATACWAFILATATLLEPAPTLDISSLQATNMNFHQQLIHNCLWIRWGQFQVPPLCPPGAGKGSSSGTNYMRLGYQSRSEQSRSEHTLTFKRHFSVTFRFHQAE